MAGSDQQTIVLGGGNPAHIPEVESAIKEALVQIINDPQVLSRAIGDYDRPKGNPQFIDAICRFLTEQYDWPIGPENIALTNGSQSAFFGLVNLLAGRMSDGTLKSILLPMVPEYIGYADAAIEPGVFRSVPARIQLIDHHLFKYHPVLDRLCIDEQIAAICISRPTNPSGNVISDQELESLWRLAQASGIPLILDCAYGPPFPNIVYTDASPFWRPGVILCMSLSKFGLPSVRTGIVVAESQIINALTYLNAATGLAPGGIGPAIMTRLISSGLVNQLCREIIRPFYQARAELAVQILMERLAGLPFRIHRPEGAFFIWLWLEDLPIGCTRLYELLKHDGVIVVPGQAFFPGLDQPWPHSQQCIRISYATSPDLLKAGLERVCSRIVRLYQDRH